MKAYAVCFVPFKKNIECMEYFSTKRKAKKYIDNIFAKFSKHHKVTLDKIHPNYICRIYLNNFYGVSSEAKVGYDSYYMEEINIQ